MAENINNTETFNIREFLGRCLSKWYWFVISLVICLGAGAYYIVKTPKIYTRSATVLIKETGLRRTSELESVLSAGGMTQQNSKLANEIIAKNHRLLCLKKRPEKYRCSMVFDSYETANDLFNGKVNAIVCIGTGKVEMHGLNGMLDNVNRILDRVALYLG